jgi:hypothetical protein
VQSTAPLPGGDGPILVALIGEEGAGVQGQSGAVRPRSGAGRFPGGVRGDLEGAHICPQRPWRAQDEELAFQAHVRRRPRPSPSGLERPVGGVEGLMEARRRRPLLAPRPEVLERLLSVQPLSGGTGQELDQARGRPPPLRAGAGGSEARAGRHLDPEGAEEVDAPRPDPGPRPGRLPCAPSGRLDLSRGDVPLHDALPRGPLCTGAPRRAGPTVSTSSQTLVRRPAHGEGERASFRPRAARPARGGRRPLGRFGSAR